LNTPTPPRYATGDFTGVMATPLRQTLARHCSGVRKWVLRKLQTIFCSTTTVCIYWRICSESNVKTAIW